MSEFSLLTYNIHKGFNSFNRNLSVHNLKEKIQNIRPDIIFLQEVQGKHEKMARKHNDWPVSGQHDYIADEDWNSIYGQNVIYDHGHHGNAILSKYPIEQHHNQDITHLKFEKRGVLFSRILIGNTPVNCICVHLSLFARSRRFQLEKIADTIKNNIPKEEPLIIAGDFNDWSVKATSQLENLLGLNEVFLNVTGRHAKSFPANIPILCLDRIYTRGLTVVEAEILKGKDWFNISDHSPLSCRLKID